MAVRLYQVTPSRSIVILFVLLVNLIMFLSGWLKSSSGCIMWVWNISIRVLYSSGHFPRKCSTGRWLVLVYWEAENSKLYNIGGSNPILPMPIRIKSYCLGCDWWGQNSYTFYCLKNYYIRVLAWKIISFFTQYWIPQKQEWSFTFPVDQKKKYRAPLCFTRWPNELMAFDVREPL